MLYAALSTHDFIVAFPSFFLMSVAIERTGNKLEVMTFTLGL